MTEYRGQIGRVRSEPRIRLARIVEIHLALLGRFESPRVQNPAASLQVLCSNDRSGLRLSRTNGKNAFACPAAQSMTMCCIAGTGLRQGTGGREHARSP